MRKKNNSDKNVLYLIFRKTTASQIFYSIQNANTHLNVGYQVTIYNSGTLNNVDRQITKIYINMELMYDFDVALI